MGVTTAFQRRRVEAMAEWGLVDTSEVLYTCPVTGWTLARPITIGDAHLLGELLDNCLSQPKFHRMFDLPVEVTWDQARAAGRTAARGVWAQEPVMRSGLHSVRDEHGHPQLVTTLQRGCAMMVKARANATPERDALLVLVAGGRELGWDEQSLELIKSIYRLNVQAQTVAA